MRADRVVDRYKRRIAEHAKAKGIEPQRQLETRGLAQPWDRSVNHGTEEYDT